MHQGLFYSPYGDIKIGSEWFWYMKSYSRSESSEVVYLGQYELLFDIDKFKSTKIIPIPLSKFKKYFQSISMVRQNKINQILNII